MEASGQVDSNLEASGDNETRGGACLEDAGTAEVPDEPQLEIICGKLDATHGSLDLEWPSPANREMSMSAVAKPALESQSEILQSSGEL